MTRKSKSRAEREKRDREHQARMEELARTPRGNGKNSRYEEILRQAYGGTAGRGQEEFTGDFGAAFDALRQRRRQEERERAHREPAPGPARGAMRPWVVGWRMVEHDICTDTKRTVALGRTVIQASSLESCKKRAPTHCSRDLNLKHSAGFQIRYILEKIK